MSVGIELYNQNGTLSLTSNVKVLAQRFEAAITISNNFFHSLQTVEGNKMLSFSSYTYTDTAQSRSIACWVNSPINKWATGFSASYDKRFAKPNNRTGWFYGEGGNYNILATHADFANQQSGYIEVFNENAELVWSLGTLAKLPIIIGEVSIPQPTQLSNKAYVFNKNAFTFNIPSQYQTGGKIYVLAPAPYFISDLDGGSHGMAVGFVIKATQVIFQLSYFSSNGWYTEYFPMRFNMPKILVGYVHD